MSIEETDANRRANEKSARRKEVRDKMMAEKTREKGLIIVHTGKGKGKSTAAFGMVMRCVGHGMKAGVVQFIKGKWETGERTVLERFPDLCEIKAIGEGFTWDTQDRARDIAHALGTVGHVSYLRRTRAGPFGLESAISLDFLNELAKARDLTRAVLPLEAALDDIPALPVTPDQAKLLRHGQRLGGFPERPGLQLATSEGTPVALVEASADGLTVVRGFNLLDVAE